MAPVTPLLLCVPWEWRHLRGRGQLGDTGVDGSFFSHEEAGRWAARAGAGRAGVTQDAHLPCPLPCSVSWCPLGHREPLSLSRQEEEGVSDGSQLWGPQQTSASLSWPGRSGTALPQAVTLH